ncbi:MAG: ferredoxin [Deltaproteobacteria bacterium]|nr:ferredoxin [Deltaproteobacteria bacterium]
MRQFSVDESLCIGCGLCHERAPDNVEIPPGAAAARVTLQPRTDEEEEACEEAADYCPTGGIHEVSGDMSASTPDDEKSLAENLDAAAS